MNYFCLWQKKIEFTNVPHNFNFQLSISNSHLHSVGVGAEFRCVLALDECVAVVQKAFLGYKHAVFQLVCAFGQELDEKPHVAVGVSLVVAYAVVVAVARNLLGRLEARRTQVFHKHKTHVLLVGESDFHRNLVADFDRCCA